MLRRLGLGLIVLPAIYALLAAVLALIPGPRADIPPAGGDVTVLMIPGPIHYDFLLPADLDTIQRFGFATAAGVPLDDPRARWILLGWGAREFYTTTGSYRDVNARAVWRGLVGDGSVMRVDALGPLPTDFPARALRMSDAHYAALLDEIARGFARDEQGRPIPLPGLGLGETDAFYEAAAPFNGFFTCNTWISRTLRAAGLDFGLWTPLPYSVTLSHWLWHRGA